MGLTTPFTEADDGARAGCLYAAHTMRCLLVAANPPNNEPRRSRREGAQPGCSALSLFEVRRNGERCFRHDAPAGAHGRFVLDIDADAHAPDVRSIVAARQAVAKQGVQVARRSNGYDGSRMSYRHDEQRTVDAGDWILSKVSGRAGCSQPQT